MGDSIPVNEVLLDGNEKEYLAACVDSGWISSEGPYVKQFEGAFAARVGRKHGIAVCNGSAALEVAVGALNLGKGDEVILPSFTAAASAQDPGSRSLPLRAALREGFWAELRTAASFRLRCPEVGVDPERRR